MILSVFFSPKVFLDPPFLFAANHGDDAVAGGSLAAHLRGPLFDLLSTFSEY